MRIGHDLTLQISNRLLQTQQAISRSLERLSTGKRVNSPQDDVASFTQLTGLQAQIRGSTRAIQNINEGRGYFSTADGALAIQQDILQRMREIAIRGANETLTVTDRENLSDELLSLRKEFDRITNTTEFNGQRLLDGSFEELQIQVGPNGGSGSQQDLDSVSTRSFEVFEKSVGTGSFSFGQTVGTAGTTGNGLREADLDNDGDLDLVSITSGGDAEIEIFINDGNGSFSAGATLTGSGGSFADVEIGDVNNDGIEDILASNGNTGDFFVYLGNGDGTFGAETQINTQLDPGSNSLSLGDFNDDGDLDLAISDDDKHEIFLGDSAGGFSSSSLEITGDSLREIFVADFNNDGFDDIVRIDYGASIISVFIGNGDGTMGSKQDFATGQRSGGDVGDVDGDGDLDLLLFNNSTGAYRTLLNDGSGSFTVDDSGSEFGIRDVELGDLDGDGDLDAVFGFNFASFKTFINDGSGDFTEDENVDLGGFSNPRAVSVSDFTGDGVLDVAGIGQGGNLGVFEGNSEEVSALADLHVLDQETAQNLIDIIDGGLEKISQARTQMGINLNQLDIQADYNLMLSENLSQARSRIEDADIAQETAELVRNQILQQSQIAALTQANTNRRMVLELLDF